MVLLSLCAVDYTSKLIADRKSRPSCEGFEHPKSSKILDASDGLSDGMLFLMYVFALSFLLIDIMVLFFAVNIALKCSKPGIQRVAHVAMALFFTFPYVLVSLFFSPCVEKM